MTTKAMKVMAPLYISYNSSEMTLSFILLDMLCVL